MQRKSKSLLSTFIPHLIKSAGFIFVFVLIFSIGTKVFAADKVGIGQFSVNPNPLTPNQEEVATISGVVYYLSSEGNLPSPSITIKINEQLSLPVEVKLLSSEQVAEDSSALLSEWSFSATWDGKNERGAIFSPGEYAYTINLDLPDAGKDTKSGKITVNATE